MYFTLFCYIWPAAVHCSTYKQHYQAHLANNTQVLQALEPKYHINQHTSPCYCESPTSIRQQTCSPQLTSHQDNHALKPFRPASPMFFFNKFKIIKKAHGISHISHTQKAHQLRSFASHSISHINHTLSHQLRRI